MVLQYEVLSVGPVVGDIALRVIAQHVGDSAIRAGWVSRTKTATGTLLCLGEESVHLPAVDVGRRVDRFMRPTTIHILMVELGLDAPAVCRIGNADGRHPI